MNISQLHYPKNNKTIDLTERAKSVQVKTLPSYLLKQRKKYETNGNLITLNQQGSNA